MPFQRAQFLVLKLGGMPPNLLLVSCFLLSFFFLSFFLTICFFFHMLDRIFTKLGQKQVWVDGYKTYGSKNSSGVTTGVKKMILRKTLLLLQITWYGLVTNLSCNGLTLSTKVMGLKIHPGSFGVTGVKNVNFYCLNDWIRRLTD